MRLFIASTKKQRGTGHLVRSKKIVEKMDSTFLFVPDFKKSHTLIDVKNDNQVSVLKNFPEDVDVIYFDNFKTKWSEFNILPKNIFKIGIDEGGKVRENMDVLIETFPSVIKNRKGVSYKSVGFLKENEKKKENKKSIKNILVCFGGEDSARLSEKVLETIKKYRLNEKYKWTIICSRLSDDSFVKIEKYVENLSEKISSWDLVITHFGLTMFESIFRNIPVLILSPTKYHKKLVKEFSLPDIGEKKINISKLLKYINCPDLIYDAIKNYQNVEKIDLSKLLNSFDFSRDACCPNCASKGAIFYRKEGYTFYKCKCSLIYQYGYISKNITYNKNYFFQEYKKQYGKTYLDDFESIYKISLKRLDVLDKIVTLDKKILDIGCAYGHFLKAASDRGYRVFGADICNDAIKYVKNMGTTAYSLDIEKDSFSNLEYYDIVTMWYVIEHIENLDLFFAKLNKILKTNGIFAFSTPNIRGISGLKNISKFLKDSPTDHWSLWSIKSAKKILKKRGFEILKVRSTGVHPERVVKNIKKDSILYKLVFKILTFLRLGDTFEIYAQKKR